LGATTYIGFAGNRTSNFAIPVSKGEWDDLGHGAEEARHRSTSGGDLYYQVDVHVCADDEEWERIFFDHSYGDLGESFRSRRCCPLLRAEPRTLGMILGLVARNNCLALGSKGLRVLCLSFIDFSKCSWKFPPSDTRSAQPAIPSHGLVSYHFAILWALARNMDTKVCYKIAGIRVGCDFEVFRSRLVQSRR
jgi:hypothetical protein